MFRSHDLHWHSSFLLLHRLVNQSGQLVGILILRGETKTCNSVSMSWQGCNWHIILSGRLTRGIWWANGKDCILASDILRPWREQLGTGMRRLEPLPTSLWDLYCIYLSALLHFFSSHKIFLPLLEECSYALHIFNKKDLLPLHMSLVATFCDLAQSSAAWNQALCIIYLSL